MALGTTKQGWGGTLDAPDRRGLGRLYARLLDWQLEGGEGDGGDAAVAPSEGGGFNLGFQTEPHHVRRVWPSEPGQPLMMMHLDIEVDDLDEAVSHAVECGAELASYQPQDNVRVLIDPAGHPFCVYLD